MTHVSIKYYLKWNHYKYSQYTLYKDGLQRCVLLYLKISYTWWREEKQGSLTNHIGQYGASEHKEQQDSWCNLRGFVQMGHVTDCLGGEHPLQNPLG